MITRLASTLFTVFMLTFFAGCTASGVSRGVTEGPAYYSTHSPNIKITLAPDYTHETAEPPGMFHRFRADRGRYIYIHQFRHGANETQIDYFDNPDYWMFEHMPTHEEFDSGTFDLLGEKWHYFNRFSRTQTACIFIRDIRAFASEHDILALRFIKWLDWRDCDVWDTRELTRKARAAKFQQFFDDFSEEAVFSRYE